MTFLFYLPEPRGLSHIGTTKCYTVNCSENILHGKWYTQGYSIVQLNAGYMLEMGSLDVCLDTLWGVVGGSLNNISFM